jgi:putative membrane protein
MEKKSNSIITKILSTIREMPQGKHILWWAILFSCFFLVGIISHHVEATREFMFFLTPWFLLVFGLISLIPNLVRKNGKFFVWAILTYVVTFFLEVLGVKTGLVFGQYIYGDTLGLKLLEVPMVIGFNWVLVIAGFTVTLEKPNIHPIFKALVVASAAVVFDFVMEPVAIAFDYWTWADVYVPLQNYVAWWLIAFFSAMGYYLAKIKVEQKLSTVYVVLQFVFFLSLLPLAL